VGGILSKDVHSYKFYAVTKESEEAELAAPLPTELPVTTALNFAFKSEPTSTYQLLNQTTVMPGFVLSQTESRSLTYSYNAKELNLNFPNLDVDLDGVPRSNVDTITYSFLLESQDQEGKRNYEAQQIVLQGDKIIRAERAQALDGSLDVVLDRSDLGAGKMLDASLAISGQGTGDLYVVLMMPNGQYLSLGETRLVSAIGEVIPFREAINLSAVKTLPLVNLPLPGGLVEGTYTFYAIFVAEKANVYDESNWVSLASSEWTYD
jgi:hypothetical protein